MAPDADGFGQGPLGLHVAPDRLPSPVLGAKGAIAAAFASAAPISAESVAPVGGTVPQLLGALAAEYDSMQAQVSRLTLENKSLRERVEEEALGYQHLHATNSVSPGLQLNGALRPLPPQPSVAAAAAEQPPVAPASGAIEEAVDTRPAHVNFNLDAVKGHDVDNEGEIETITPPRPDTRVDFPSLDFVRQESGVVFSVRPAWTVKDFEVRRVQRLNQARVLIDTSPRGGKTKGNSRLLLSRSGVGGALSMTSRQHCLHVVHPQSCSRMVWDLMGAMFIFYDMIVVPLEFLMLPDSSFLEAMAWLIAVYWSLDILASFTTGQYVNGKLVMDPARIARRYALTWLPFDVLIVLPDWLSLLFEDKFDFLNSLSILRGARALRFVRLLRVVKLDKAVKIFQERINSNYILLCAQLCKLILMLMVVNHFLGCLWFGLGAATENGWAQDPAYQTTDLLNRYLTSVDWALGQFHGEEKIRPRTEYERIFAVAVLFFAMALLSSFLSSVTSLMMQLQSLTRERTRKMHALHGYLHQHNISAQLSVRVKKYVLEQVELRKPQEHEVELLQHVTPGLLAELRDEARSPTIAAHQFFCDLRSENPRVVTRLCHEAMQPVSSQGGEIVFHTGDACTRMLFVQIGSLKYIFRMHKQFCKTQEATIDFDGARSGATSPPHDGGPDARPSMLSGEPPDEPEEVPISGGMWLSEAALWTVWEHCGELVAQSDAYLLSLDALEFARLLKEYECAHVHAALYARAFVHFLNSDQRLCSDAIDPAHSPPGLSEVVRAHLDGINSKSSSQLSMSTGPLSLFPP
mmetsp:Transcript_19487/g.52230  ORF Transcript_19487/g.52230 Transcript_19487/m.52230 type:complete len:804 (+) Transcript_19487:68-2479(+)